jgi:hypothetical protein
MSLIAVDVESDGPIPNLYSMVNFGAVIVDLKLDKTFEGKTKPISDLWIPDALAVSGYTREQHLTFEDPKEVMLRFEKWINENSIGKPTFISDNNGFDWQWINYYFHFYLGRNPFGFSSRRIGDLYCGLKQDSRLNREWKRLRRTKHTHNPVEDAIGNAESLIEIQKMGLKLGIK